MKRQPRQTKRELKAHWTPPESEPYSICIAGQNVTIPYVASWSSEMPDLRVAPEPLMGGKPALFRARGRRGDGKPVLGKMDVGRQRLCVLKTLCQVCAAPIKGPAWYALIEEHLLLNGMPARAVREPAACTNCMLQSLLVCPGLHRINPRIVWPRRITTLVTMTTPPIGGIGPLSPDGPELETPPPPVIGYLKVIIDDFRVDLSLMDFVRAYSGALQQKESG